MGGASKILIVLSTPLPPLLYPAPPPPFSAWPVAPAAPHSPPSSAPTPFPILPILPSTPNPLSNPNSTPNPPPKENPTLTLAPQLRPEFVVLGRMPKEFVKAAEACLAFPRDRPDALRLLGKKNIEVIVNSGSPSLFKNGASQARRMRLFLSGDESNVSQI